MDILINNGNSLLKDFLIDSRILFDSITFKITRLKFIRIFTSFKLLTNHIKEIHDFGSILFLSLVASLSHLIG